MSWDTLVIWISVIHIYVEREGKLMEEYYSITSWHTFRSSKKHLSMADISSISVGQKDYKRSLFKIWQEIFSIPRQKRYSFHLVHVFLVFWWKQNIYLHFRSLVLWFGFGIVITFQKDIPVDFITVTCHLVARFFSKISNVHYVSSLSSSSSFASLENNY